MTLIIRPIQAVLARDTNLFTSMDPYCIISLGEQARKTSPHFGGGKKPVWGQVLKFQLGRTTQLTIEVWAKSIIGNDSLIGHAIIDLAKLKISHHPTLQCTVFNKADPVNLFYENKVIGKVLLEIQVSNSSNLIQNTPIQNGPNQTVSNISSKNETAQDIKVEVANEFQQNSRIGQNSMIHGGNNFPMNQTVDQRQNRLMGSEMNSFINSKHTHHKIFQKNNRLQNLHNLNNAIQPDLEQQKVNHFMNQQVFNSFIGSFTGQGSQIQNNLPEPVKPRSIHEQQMLYNQHKLQNSSFINPNPVSTNSGLTVGTVYAHPSHLKGSGASTGTAATPVKPILNKSKSRDNLYKGKSPGNKKVKFADEVKQSNLY